MGQPIDDQNIEEQVDAALERARHEPEPLRIVEASYHRALDLFELRISTGHGLVFAREDLQPLDAATPEQAAGFTTKPNGRHLWWPKLDDGLSLIGLLPSASLRPAAARKHLWRGFIGTADAVPYRVCWPCESGWLEFCECHIS